jgi:hypothetical protein
MNNEPKRHPFLDDLSDNVILVSSVLRREISGREAVLKIVKAGASQYLSQKPTFLKDVDDHRFFEYDFDLEGGIAGKGLVSIVRDAGHKVVRLNISFSPLDAVIRMAEGARDALRDDFDRDLFL